MLLAVDIGNSNITLGIFKGDKIIEKFRLCTTSEKTSDEYSVFLRGLLVGNKIDPLDVKACVISSVVPFVMHSFVSGVYKTIKKQPLIVGPGVKTGINIQTDNPNELGADRIVDAVAAYTIYGGPVIVIDFGTATTFDYISKNGVFECGVTSPGIGISANALWKKTAKLPEIEIKKPKSILAKNTIASMQAGVVYGYIGHVDYIVRKMKEELKIDAKVVVTGGLANVVLDAFSDFTYDPDLTLHGLRFIYEKNEKLCLMD